jgi:hypothetical protein
MPLPVQVLAILKLDTGMLNGKILTLYKIRQSRLKEHNI